MIKAWKRNTSSLDISSYQLLESVMDFLEDEYTDGADCEEYAEVVKNFFEYLKKKFADKSYSSHLKTAYERAKKALEYMDNDKLDKACDEWRKIFGSVFPKCKKERKAKTIVPPPVIDKPQRLWSNLA